jgi:lysozyme family protein
MITAKFRRCHTVTARWEGGWSDHKADPGGKTMYGITEAVYHAWLRRKGQSPKPVRGITRGEAETIFFANYWQAAQCDRLAPGVDLATYDSAVNSGVSRGRKWLLASIGGPDEQTVRRMCAARLAFVRGLSTWKSFGKGWSNRIADIERTGVAWAREPSPKLTLDFPPIATPPLPASPERGNFLLDLIRFIWSKLS